jgi:hypothetical protein
MMLLGHYMYGIIVKFSNLPSFFILNGTLLFFKLELQPHMTHVQQLQDINF